MHFTDRKNINIMFHERSLFVLQEESREPFKFWFCIQKLLYTAQQQSSEVHLLPMHKPIIKTTAISINLKYIHRVSFNEGKNPTCSRMVAQQILRGALSKRGPVLNVLVCFKTKTWSFISVFLVLPEGLIPEVNTLTSTVLLWWRCCSEQICLRSQEMFLLFVKHEKELNQCLKVLTVKNGSLCMVSTDNMVLVDTKN